MEKKYSELNDEQKKELLWNIVTAFEAMARAKSLKKFNYVDENDLEQYNYENLQAAICLHKICTIKKIKNGNGYYGKLAQDKARVYVKKSYDWAKEKIKGVSYEN